MAAEVEVPFETLIGDRPVRGRIDAVFDDAGDGMFDVVDWKTGAAARLGGGTARRRGPARRLPAGLGRAGRRPGGPGPRRLPLRPARPDRPPRRPARGGRARGADRGRPGRRPLRFSPPDGPSPRTGRGHFPASAAVPDVRSAMHSNRPPADCRGSGTQIPLDGLDLGREAIGDAGAQVGLEHQADPGAPGPRPRPPPA